MKLLNPFELLFRSLPFSQLSSLSNVRKVWNSVFPNEKLEFKHYGYHDAKGLLADMAVVAQVGKSQKYVLKVGKGGKVSSPSRSFTQHGSSVPPRWNLCLPFCAEVLHGER